MSAALAVLPNEGEDTLITSALENIAAMSSAELHSEIVRSWADIVQDSIQFEGLVLDARRRMHAGESIGGCDTWESYVEKYLKRGTESLASAKRRIRRVMHEKNPATDTYSNHIQRRADMKSLTDDLRTEKLRAAGLCPTGKKQFESLDAIGEWRHAQGKDGPFRANHCRQCGKFHLDRRQDNLPVFVPDEIVETPVKETSLEEALEKFVTKIVMQPYGYYGAKFAKYPQQHTTELAVIAQHKEEVYEEIGEICQRKKAAGA